MELNFVIVFIVIKRFLFIGVYSTIFLLFLFQLFSTSVYSQSVCNTKSSGDADCNGKIDTADFELWRKESFGELQTKSADFNGDSVVSIVDFEIWRKSFFNIAPSVTVIITVSPSPTFTITPSIITPTITPTRATTPTSSITPSPVGKGIWISTEEIAKLPITGQTNCLSGSLCANAWNDILAAANSNWGTANVSDYTGLAHSQKIYAGALVAAKYKSMNKLEASTYYQKVVQGLTDVMGTEKPALPSSNGGKIDGSLAISRQLLRYIISADLLGIYPDGNSSSIGTKWGNYMQYMFTTKFTFRVGDGGKTISENHMCASNGCAMAGASRVALAIYLKNTTELNIAWNTFRRYTGDLSSPISIEFSNAGLNWYHVSSSDDAHKVGINPKGATCYGKSYPADGVIPNDQGRGGDCPSSSGTEPLYTQYPWEGLQGAYAQAFMLNRLGYNQNGLIPFNINDKALLRAVQYQWMLQQKFGGVWYDKSRASWVKHLANKFYSFKPIQYDATDEGRNMAFTQWTNP